MTEDDYVNHKLRVRFYKAIYMRDMLLFSLILTKFIEQCNTW